jgi:hypothetical protein
MTPSPRGGTASRLAAIAAVAVAAFAGALALPVLRGLDPPQVGAEAGLAASSAEQIGAWLVQADVALLPDLGYRLDIRLTRDVGAPPPDRLRPIVVVGMEGMADTRPPLTLVGSGDWRAEGTLPMPGRWRFGIGFGEDLTELVVDVPPPGEAK